MEAKHCVCIKLRCFDHTVIVTLFAALQAVIVPCGVTASLAEDKKAELMKKCTELKESLIKAGVKVRADLRDNYSPGWKFNHWELKVRFTARSRQ